MIFRKFLPFLMMLLFIVSSCQGNQPNSTVNNDNQKSNTINLLTGKPMSGKPLLNDTIVFRSDEAQKFLNMNYEQRTKYFNERKVSFKIKDLVDNSCIYDEGYYCKDENGQNAICYRKSQGDIDSCGRCQLNDLFYGQDCSYTANQSYYLSGNKACVTNITYAGGDYDRPMPYPSCRSCNEGEHPVFNSTKTWVDRCEKDNVDFCSTSYDSKGQAHENCIRCGEGYEIKFDDGQAVGCKLQNQEEYTTDGFNLKYEPNGVDGLNKTSLYKGSCQ